MKTTIAIIALAAAAAGGFYLGSLRSVEPEDSPTLRKFELLSDIDVFQFTGENLTPAQTEINEILLDLREAFVSQFYGETNIFFELEEVKNYLCRAYFKCSVVQNTEKIFSCLINTYLYHHGANGCHSGAIGVNYAIENDRIRKIEFAELFSSDAEKNAFLRRALAVIKSREGELWVDPEKISDAELSSLETIVQFVLTKDKLTIMFPPYTIACGACGILTFEEPYQQK
ncbi:MAG: DUF3298 domain-containing protein [Opitutales bacterium]|nr:DUF3298 domain-containing protein [Opitutales bacterium]